MYLKFHVKTRLWAAAAPQIAGGDGRFWPNTGFSQAHAPPEASLKLWVVFFFFHPTQEAKMKMQHLQTPTLAARVQGCVARQGWCQQEGCSTRTAAGAKPGRGRNKGCYQSLAGGWHYCFSTYDICQAPGATRGLFAWHDPELIRLANKSRPGI